MSTGHNDGSNTGRAPRRDAAAKKLARPIPREQTAPATDRDPPIRVLVVTKDDTRATWLGSCAADRGLVVERVQSFEDAERRMAEDTRRVELALLHVSRPGDALLARELTRRVSQRLGGGSCVFVVDRPGLGDAIEAMRCGAVDFVDVNLGDTALEEAVEAAVRRVHLDRERQRRIERLRGVCRKLDTARTSITDQVSSMCTDLVDAYRELSSQLDVVSLSGEYNGIARQELEVESLLRVTLEFVLAKTSACNAAVYLPSGSGDEFSLGAFVNYDREPASLSVLLDRMAESLAPALEIEGGTVRATTDPELDAILGPDAHWLDAQDVVAASCENNDECLAVVLLFRDRRSPLPTKAEDILATVAGPFAAQLARIIRVHHRNLPVEDQPDGFGNAFGTDPNDNLPHDDELPF